MECNRHDIVKFLNCIAGVTGLNLVHTDFRDMQERLSELYAKANAPAKMTPLSDEYLYRKLFRPTERGEEILKLNPAILNNIAQAIGFKSYAHFLKVSDPMSNPTIQNSIGVWYSYVRCNSGQPYVYRAPVKIFEEKREVLMEMKGPVRKFSGHVHAMGECLRCNLLSENKSISLVLKAGIAAQPKVLQGVFAGVSTAGDPIAGREILIRQDAEYDTLENERILIDNLIADDDRERKSVGTYFYNKESNIIKGGRASTFGLDDLAIE